MRCSSSRCATELPNTKPPTASIANAPSSTKPFHHRRITSGERPLRRRRIDLSRVFVPLWSCGPRRARRSEKEIMPGLVLREDKNGLTTLVLNRPDKLNALNVEMFVELREHIERISAETDRVGLVIVRGAGKCFSAGHDLGDIAKGERPPRPHFQSETIERLANLPQPVISAVHGHCYTGALELALAGDLIIAAESAKFADTHAR